MSYPNYPKQDISWRNWPGAIVLLLTVLVAVWVWYDTRPERAVPISELDVDREGLPDTIPDFASEPVVQARKDQFYEFILPMIEAENRRLEQIRQYLVDWSAYVGNENNLPAAAIEQLSRLADRYYVDTEQPLDRLLNELLIKVDTLPPSLIVAQAANESAWGTSRFALEGNNLFGQWCFSEGCGLVPQSRPEGEIYEVRSFEEPLLSVRAFILNLNRHFSYESLREERAAMKARDEAVTGVDLAPHLLAYSTRREAYVDEIIEMIQFNDLQALDQ